MHIIETNIDLIDMSTETSTQLPDIMVYQEKWLRKMKKLDKARAKRHKEYYQPRYDGLAEL